MQNGETFLKEMYPIVAQWNGHANAKLLLAERFLAHKFLQCIQMIVSWLILRPVLSRFGVMVALSE